MNIHTMVMLSKYFCKGAVLSAVIILLGSMFCARNVCAAPAYGTRMPEAKAFFIGGQTHQVFERDLEANHGDIQSLQHFLNISYGVTDWFTLDLKGGAGNVAHDRLGLNDLDYASFVGGGYGFRVRLWETEKVKGVAGFQHISIHPYSRNVGEDKYKSVIDDWQLSATVSYQVGDRWMPYAGGKVSRMDNIQWTNGERDRIKSDESRAFGLILGADWEINEKVWINVEGQALDVQALSTSINVRF